MTLDETCFLTRYQIRLFGIFRIDSKYMGYTKEEVDRIIEKRCLPSEMREAVERIISTEDYEQSIDDLNHLEAKCYRFEPNHPRYDSRRDEFPGVEEREMEAA
ncbi:hypothetical protein [Roseovarius rhodophyticola]|uniref:Uncharacterized protein n=1 Tax=Roseovarius rhodophyticola TaxID=3080827 RepID=A0ABZ2TJE8_9RHOB|nr:hypothetical protein [Roseovarius sp. W115]MDV2930184.1 hypothetical protein [Roseovarius sp. W115]